MKSLIRRFQGMMCFTLLAACGNTGGVTDDTETDDQAPYVISIDIAASEPSAVFIEARRIDLDGLSNPVFGLNGAHLLPSGEVLVVDWRQDRAVRISLDTNSTNAIGGRGEGPGEFLSIGAAALLDPDSVIFFDPQLRRFSVFHISGSLGRTFSPSWLESGDRIEELHSTPAGILLTFKGAPDSNAMQAMMAEPTRDSIQLGFMNRDGRLTVAPGLTIPDRLWEVQSRGNAYSVEAVAGGPTALVATSTTGVIVGRNVTDEVEFWPYESLGSSGARLIRSGLDEDESQARFGTVIADGHGRFWVTDAKGQDSASRNWYRVALDGTVSDVLSMPLNHGLLAARGDTLLVRVGLELGQVDLHVGSIGVLERDARAKEG